MSYDQNNSSHHDFEPWDQGVYRTGSTQPPKNHGGIIAILLIAVILLSGVVSVLGVMNIRLFRQLNHTPEQTDAQIKFSNTDHIPVESANPTEVIVSTDPALDIDTSLISVDNTPVEGGLSLQAIYEKTIPSVVSISCTYYGGSSTGTGVILSQDGYIVTNSHVVEDAAQVQVLLTDGRTLDAELVGADEISDLAVLHVEADNLIPARLGDSSVLRVGDTVVAIGDPLGIALRGTMTDGIVSAINRDIDVGGRTMNLIQTNAALNSGNSGGPLINCYGQVIGINTMKMGDSMSSSGVEGLGFAIPSTTVEDIVNQIILKGYVSGRPEIGITGEGLSQMEQFYYRLPRGLYITEVAEGSSAQKAGIQPGDILISINDTAITSSDVLKNLLYTFQPGDTVNAVIYRSGKQYAVSIPIDEATG
jgi:serine protease Do